MRYLLFIMALFTIGCAAPHYSRLPQGVFVKDARLSEITDEAIKEINNVFGNVFYQSNALCEGDWCNSIINVAITSVECDSGHVAPQDHGKAELEWDEDGVITRARVFIDCEVENTHALMLLIAHELWNCLGFEESPDESCLSNHLIPAEKEFADLICPEMIAAFRGQYGGEKWDTTKETYR